MNIPWEAIIALIEKLIANCPDPEPAVMSRLKRFGLLERFRTERAIRDGLNLSHAEWKAQGKEIMAEISAAHAEATDDDFKALIAQSKAA